MPKHLLILALLTSAVACAPATPPTKVAPASGGNVMIRHSHWIDFRSSVNGHSYRLNIAIPRTPPPPEGYGVLYLFDGNHYFGSVAEAARSNGNAPDVVVVGIGYPETEAFIQESEARHGPPSAVFAALDRDIRALARERQWDLTLPMTETEVAAQFPSGPPPYGAADVGGLDQLLETIEADVKPRIAALTKIDPTNQALFGHSLGGLAVLRALFTRPHAYRSFIAASPSIWWNNRAILAGESGFIEAVGSRKATPRILITMGAHESPEPLDLSKGIDRRALSAAIERHDMVGNAAALVDRLQAVKGPPGYEVADYALFADQGHGISVWPAIGRAITFAFQK